MVDLLAGLGLLMVEVLADIFQGTGGGSAPGPTEVAA